MSKQLNKKIKKQKLIQLCLEFRDIDYTKCKKVCGLLFECLWNFLVPKSSL